MNVKAILVDIDNTLLDFNASAKKAMSDAYAEFGIPRPADFFETFKRINDGLWLKIEAGELTRAGLHEVRWKLIFDELKIDFDGRKFEKKFLSNLFDCAVPVEGAAEIMRYLSAKYPVYTASNAFYEQQLNRLAISGLAPFIKENFVSEKIGHSKPSTRFFDECFKSIPYAPKDTVMIGDSLSADIEGGKNYGLVTCWYNPAGMRIAAPKADYIIYKLSDLKNIL